MGGFTYPSVSISFLWDTTTKLLQVNKKHSKNALIFYMILVADTQLYWPSYVIKNFFLQ
jgi:hypothetical protein